MLRYNNNFSTELVWLQEHLKNCGYHVLRTTYPVPCNSYRNIIQELSYRKEIARQLRTQFVEGISVTLKSTLKWSLKRIHWTDHTRLTVRRVIGR